MGMVVVEISLHLLLTLLIIFIGRNVMYVNQFNTRFLGNLTIPFAVGIISPLYLTVFPDVTRCEVLRGVRLTKIGVAPFSRASSIILRRYQPKL